MTASHEPRLIRRRLRFERDYTQVPNRWVRDESLTWGARGLLGFLLSHQEGWKITLKLLAAQGPDGLHATRSAARELEKAGYLIRTPRHAAGRFVGDDWELSDPHDDGTVPLDTAFENRTRTGTAFENRTRTAFENRTPLRTPVEEINSSVGDPSRQTCTFGPRQRKALPCEPTENGRCFHCGEVIA